MDLSSELEERVRKDLLEAKPPLLPEVARAVIEATKSERVEPKGVADLLKRDAAMAAGVLRTANSPAYAPRAAIITVPQAISRLGFDAIRRIAMLVACDQLMFVAPGREAVTRRLYFHSTLTAFVAQEIARILKKNVEEAFMGGLLHDVGRSIVLQSLSRLEGKARRFSDGEVEIVTRGLHEVVGGRVLTTWGLPERSIASVAYHHRPLEAPTARDVACIVSIADELAHAFEGVSTLDWEGLTARLDGLNLYQEDVAGLVDRRDELLAWARGL